MRDAERSLPAVPGRSNPRIGVAPGIALLTRDPRLSISPPGASPMSLSRSKASPCLVATLALAAALGLSACSRSQALTDPLTGPAHAGAHALAAGGNRNGHGGG